MLTSLNLQLKSPGEARLPASLGRAAQAALLDLIAQRDPAVADQLHADHGLRPYTVSIDCNSISKTTCRY